jgi:hypothetical protein
VDKAAFSRQTESAGTPRCQRSSENVVFRIRAEGEQHHPRQWRDHPSDH